MLIHVPNTLFLFVLATPALFVAGTAEEDYQRLKETWEAADYRKASELAQAFLEDHPDHKSVESALYLGANADTHTGNYQRAIPLYRTLLEEYPQSDSISQARHELVVCLAGTRALTACIAQCRENLTAEPESPQGDYWRFLIPQSEFRLWHFEESERGFRAFLERHPESTYAGPARNYLAKIEPSWTMDDNGVVEYSGKYEKDHRLKSAIAALPGHVKEGRAQIHSRLGVDVGRDIGVNFIFRDAGDDDRKGLMAETYTISRDYKPVTVVLFYAEHVVVDPEEYRKTLVHELKHAGFRKAMGQTYNDLPEWIKEGLAQWAAEQLEDRISTSLNNKVFSGKAPLAVLDGVADLSHDLGDYLEDVLAFEWLEKRKKGSVARFCRGLVKGKPWREVLATASRLEADEAIQQMDEHCRTRMNAVLGKAGSDAVAIRDTFYAEGRKGGDSFNAWLQEEGVPGFAGWLDDNPGHVLEPLMWFYTGRGLILTGQHAAGRKWMRRLVEEGASRSSLGDDALFWEGYAFQQEGNGANAERCFGVLLRDYSWSKPSAKVRGVFQPAGPETEDE